MALSKMFTLVVLLAVLSLTGCRHHQPRQQKVPVVQEYNPYSEGWERTRMQTETERLEPLRPQTSKLEMGVPYVPAQPQQPVARDSGIPFGIPFPVKPNQEKAVKPAPASVQPILKAPAEPMQGPVMVPAKFDSHSI